MGVSSDAKHLRKVELYANAEPLGTVTTNGSEDSRAEVLRGKEHTLYIHTQVNFIYKMHTQQPKQKKKQPFSLASDNYPQCPILNPSNS